MLSNCFIISKLCKHIVIVKMASIEHVSLIVVKLVYKNRYAFLVVPSLKSENSINVLFHYRQTLLQIRHRFSQNFAILFHCQLPLSPRWWSLENLHVSDKVAAPSFRKGH
jgi:hypothetical protein